MEEEKAAAYYNELLGKGRNAALFKQGLGFGSNASNAPAAKYGMLNFVGAGKSTKADEELGQPRPSESADATNVAAAKYGMINFVGAGKSAEARKEVEEPRAFSKPADRDGDGQSSISLSKKGPEDVRSGSRSRSEERDRRERSDNKDRSSSRSKEKRGRHRSRSREPRGSSLRDGRHGSRSRSKERNRRDRSGSWSKKSRRSESRDRSRSPLRKKSRSRSRSRDRGHRYRRDRKIRSRSRSRDRSQRHQRDQRSRSRSRFRESDRKRRNVSRSRSRERNRRDYKESRGRSKSGSPGRKGRDRGLDDDRKDRSRSDHRQDTRHSSPSRRQKGSARRVERDQDWAKLIPGFDSMTPAEKVKAKMKLQLSQTVVKDAGKGVEEEWERFDFNKDAPLDGDAKQDYFGDGTGASTDTAQIDNLGGSHLFITEQARREAQLQAAHEDAIFGARVIVEDKDIKRRSTWRARESKNPRGVDNDVDEDDNDTVATKVSGVVSEQIIALQAGSSWQERIKKMRAAQAQDES